MTAKTDGAGRIKRRRSKGWTAPRNVRYVGRPTRWANPYIVVFAEKEWMHGYQVIERESLLPCRSIQIAYLDAAQIAVNLYADHAKAMLEKDPQWLRGLEGKNLLCWCDLDRPCHADVLLQMANGLSEPDRGEAWRDQLLPAWVEKCKSFNR